MKRIRLGANTMGIVNQSTMFSMTCISFKPDSRKENQANHPVATYRKKLPSPVQKG